MRTTFFIYVFTFLFTPAFAQQQTKNIAAPATFKRIKAEAGSFSYWLRHTSLKKDKTVYLYNGQKKRNQQAQFAVLDISIGKSDLQQCADAVIRLYAEWQYSRKQYSKIVFLATDGTVMDYAAWRQGYRYVLRKQKLQKVKSAGISDSRTSFDHYLQTVFSFAGTLSLPKQLKIVADPRNIMAGDLFVQGGSPGHAVIVMDVVVNPAGSRRFLLAQSYMPAQSIHILKNPLSGSPWYSYDPGNELVTPEWTFKAGTLYRWI